MSKQGQIQFGAADAGSVLASRPRLPSVDLMPAYVARRRAGRALQIKAGVVLAVVVLALVGGYAGIKVWAGGAEDQLARAEAEATRLAKQREQYAELIQVNQDLAKTEDALAVAVSYEIRWPELIDLMFDNLPPDSVLTNITLQGMSAGQGISASDNVLAPARIGAVTLGVETPTLPAVSAWLRGFNAIPGLEDGTYTSASRQDELGGVIWSVSGNAQVNLIGLVGSPLFPDDFQEWLATAKQPGAQPTAEGSAD